MHFPIASLLALTIGLAPAVGRSQDSPQRRDPRDQIQPVGRIEAAKHQLQLDPPPGPRAEKPDSTRLRQEADELSSLAQSIPADMVQITQGKLPKGMTEKLKRIEKLSKHLRGELTP